MITEDYVSYETAKLLKEKGFDERVITFYNGKTHKIQLIDKFINNQKPFNLCLLAPTHQMAMKWLREVHKIHVAIYPYGEYSCDNYQFDVYKDNNFVVSKDDGYTTYEEAVEAALKYCLTNLI